MDGNDGDDEEVGKRGGRVDTDQPRCEFGRVPHSGWLSPHPDPAGWNPRPPPGARA